MSRSYKKTPIYTVKGKRGMAKYFKNLANRRLRRKKFPQRKSKVYKKIYETWHIVDYRFYKTKPFVEDKVWSRIWEKYYHRK